MNEEKFFEEIKSYKFIANKSLGQNFLVVPDVASSIVKKLNIKEDDRVLEIGAGLGSLSYFIVQNNAKTDLIDVDERMLTFLSSNFKDNKNVNIRRQNILKDDLSSFTKVIGNLPYYITSSIIKKILLEGVNATTIVLMTQKEVYPKLLKDNKSPLSLLLNYVCDISSPMNVNRNNFAPVPHVDSVVFTLIPNNNIKNKENKELMHLMEQLFLLRRKNILNNLTNVIKDKEKASAILTSMNIDFNKRPEELEINFYIDLLKHL